MMVTARNNFTCVRSRCNNLLDIRRKQKRICDQCEKTITICIVAECAIPTGNRKDFCEKHYISDYRKHNHSGFYCLICEKEILSNSNGNFKYCSKDCYKLGTRIIRFGISVKNFWDLYNTFDGSCFICKKKFSNFSKMNIDHDHSCCSSAYSKAGCCVRGLLCASCNWGLGHFKDDIDIMASGINYLKGDSENDC